MSGSDLSEDASSLSFAFPRQRRHTLYFLDEAAHYRPVYLDAEVDMSRVMADRARRPDRPSYVAYVIRAVARVIERHPEANVLITGRLFPRLARLPRINAKFTLDKTIDGQRVVVSAVIEDANRASVGQIQERVDYFKDRPVEACPEFAPLLRLQSLPVWLGRRLFALAMRSPARKSRLQGSFAVTSLGHLPVLRFAPMVGATLTFGVGAIADRPVVVDGAVTTRPLMTLTMAFDHRVLDGAVSAQILTSIKTSLEEDPEN